jgi:branched-chain amino acid aminotransferase
MIKVHLKHYMESTKFIWIDGKFVQWDEAKIHVLTHSLHYGAGVFEGIRFYSTKKGPAIFRLDEHIQRLFYSAKCVEMKIPFSKNELKNAIIELINKNGVKSGYIRPIAYFGYGKMGLNPKNCPVSVAIAVWPWGSYLGEKPVKCKISSFMRIHPKTTHNDAKICGHYVNSILASLEIHGKGYDEAILLDFKGNIAEGPGENIFIVKKGVLLTPAKGSILSGITRDTIIKIAKLNKTKVKVGTITKRALFKADEAFFSGTAAEVTPIASVNKKKIKDGKAGEITTLIKEEYMKVVQGENEKFFNWLTFTESA